MSTITVIVQAPYPLYADNGQELPQDGNSYVVENTDRIQQYIQLGQLSVIPDAPAPAPAAQDEAPTVSYTHLTLPTNREV